jgi:hypothetical protein
MIHITDTSKLEVVFTKKLARVNNNLKFCKSIEITPENTEGINAVITHFAVERAQINKSLNHLKNAAKNTH